MSSAGQSGADKQTRFAKDKKHYAGLGVLGNGTYAAETPKNSASNYGLKTARNYSNRAKDGTVRMTLDKDAKITTFKKLANDRTAFESKLISARNSGALKDKDYNYLKTMIGDAGRYGALRGFDAWHDSTGGYSGASSQNPYWVITNRSKIIIQNERYT